MQQLVLFLHTLICIGLIVLILIQHGKGADVGATFGGGASQTIFGSQGSGSFLLKITGLLAALFFVTSLILTYMTSHGVKQSGFQLPVSTTIPATQPEQPIKSK
jgi:preprotein translocase subunit SecG